MIDDRKHVHSALQAPAVLPSYFTEHCTVYPVFLFNETQELIEKGGIQSFIFTRWQSSLLPLMSGKTEPLKIWSTEPVERDRRNHEKTGNSL
jgi:hypothetical protein